jgi:tetratricopeptide (TPR) repeat protein
VALVQGDLATARSLFEESQAFTNKTQAAEQRAYILNNLGLTARYQGDFDRARRLHEESLALHQEQGNSWGQACALNDLGLVARETGDLDTAERLCREGLARFRELGDRRRQAMGLELLASVAALRGEARRAARLFGAEQALRESVGAPRPPVDRPRYEVYLSRARADLGDAAFAAAWAEGQAMPPEEALEAALAGEIPVGSLPRNHPAGA